MNSSWATRPSSACLVPLLLLVQEDGHPCPSLVRHLPAMASSFPGTHGPRSPVGKPLLMSHKAAWRKAGTVPLNASISAGVAFQTGFASLTTLTDRPSLDARRLSPDPGVTCD